MSKPRVVKVSKISNLNVEEERFVADCFKGIVNVTVTDMIENKPTFMDKIKKMFK